MLQTGRIAAVRRISNVLDGRAGFRISADWGQVSVLAGGGHICELCLNSVPGVNPLWRPQWTTIDPDRYTPGKHRRVYGPPPDGELLAGIAGHSLSFDHFGPPSKEETAAGLTTHGEAPSTKWRLLKKSDSLRPTLHYGSTLREAQIDFSRKISVDRTSAVVYCEEHAMNLSCYDRPISWNEHVTFGPPFLECRTTVFDMPATHAKVCPSSYSERIFLQPDVEFTWPRAPTQQGGTADLRTTPDQQFGHYTAQLLDPSLEIGFVSACNPSQNDCWWSMYSAEKIFPGSATGKSETIAPRRRGKDEPFAAGSSSAQRPFQFRVARPSSKAISLEKAPIAGSRRSRVWEFAT